MEWKMSHTHFFPKLVTFESKEHLFPQTSVLLGCIYCTTTEEQYVQTAYWLLSTAFWNSTPKAKPQSMELMHGSKWPLTGRALCLSLWNKYQWQTVMLEATESCYADVAKSTNKCCMLQVPYWVAEHWNVQSYSHFARSASGNYIGTIFPNQ